MSSSHRICRCWLGFAGVVRGPRGRSQKRPEITWNIWVAVLFLIAVLGALQAKLLSTKPTGTLSNGPHVVPTVPAR